MGLAGLTRLHLIAYEGVPLASQEARRVRIILSVLVVEVGEDFPLDLEQASVRPSRLLGGVLPISRAGDVNAQLILARVMRGVQGVGVLLGCLVQASIRRRYG